MWIAALVTSAVLMLPGQVENVTYKVCMYNCFAFCREGYTDAERAECERQRLSCQRNCIPNSRGAIQVGSRRRRGASVSNP
jgi:hypothetical protein